MTNQFEREVIDAACEYISIYRGWMECEDTGAAFNAAFNRLHEAVTGKTAIEFAKDEKELG